MIAAVAMTLVAVGACILVAALVPVRHLIGRLPPGSVRSRWHVMTALIVLFIAGYVSYAVLFWRSHSALLDLIVPGVFFFGACFVWLTATLSLQTATDVIRVHRLERETHLDHLTGVFNRRYLDEFLEREFARSHRYALPLSVLLLDIDRFKRINDQHGHPAGDRTLIELARTVHAELRETDVLTRFGGEEFLVITPNTPLEDAALLAERLRARVATHDFALPGEGAGAVTISIGVASLAPAIGSREALIQVADENLYRAKREGRNRVVAGMPTAPVAKVAARK